MKSQATPASFEYLPAFWEDDFCQVELLPADNEPFIRSQCETINSHGAKHFDGFGFTGIMVRGEAPFPTRSAEYRADALQLLLQDHGLQEAYRITFDGHMLLDCQSGPTKAFGLHGFDLFFDVNDGMVTNLWFKIAGISAETESVISAVLYDLGESYNLVLANWNIAGVVDLRDKQQIGIYLQAFKTEPL